MLGHNLLISSYSSGGFAQTDVGGQHSIMAIMPCGFSRKNQRVAGEAV